MSGAVREDDAYYSHKRRFTEDSLIPDPPKYSLSRPRALKSCGVGGVRALGARNTIYAVNENRVAFEFANISREELDGVRRYLAKNCSEKGEGEEGGKNAEGDDDVLHALDARSDDDDDSDDEDFGVAREDDSESDDDDDSRESDSESDDDDEDEEEEASDSEEDSADGAGRKRARDEIPAATSSPAPAAGEDSEEEEEEEEEEEDSDEDGAFEVVPVAKTARR